MFTADEVAKRMNAKVSADAITQARRRQELVAVQVGRGFFYRLRDVEAWIAAQASIAEAATEVIVESMRRTARLKALANCDFGDGGPLPAASMRVVGALLARGFVRAPDNGQHYRLGTLSVTVTGGKHDKKASCRIALDSGGRNNLSSWEMSDCREDVVLVVIDAVLAYLATEPIQAAIAETAARRSKVR